MPASRRESENAVGSYDVDVVVIIAVVAVSMTSLSNARVDVFRHLVFLLLLPLKAREEKDDDDARKREAQKWHSRRLRVFILTIGGATAARADIARINLYCIKSGGKFSPTYLKTLIIESVCLVVRVRVVILVFKFLLVKEHHAQHKVDDKYSHQRDDHGRRGALPDAFSAADCGRPPSARYDGDDGAKRYALGGHDADVAQL